MTNSQTELGNQGRPWPRIHLLVTVCSTPGLAAQLASKDGRHIAQEGLRSRSRMGDPLNIGDQSTILFQEENQQRPDGEINLFQRR